jgi:hypothetical protein
MYVVHVNDGSRTATIHLVGGCGVQGKLSTKPAGSLELWSYPIAELQRRAVEPLRVVID